MAPYYLSSTIVDFEFFLSVNPEVLPETSQRIINVGDRYQGVFLWDNIPYVGTSRELSTQISPYTRRLMQDAPLSLFDLALHSSSERLKGHAVNAFSYLTNAFGRNKACDWATQQAIRQCIKIDIERLRLRQRDIQSHDKSIETIDLIEETKVRLLGPSECLCVLAKDLPEKMELHLAGESVFKTTTLVANVLGFDVLYSLDSGTEFFPLRDKKADGTPPGDLSTSDFNENLDDEAHNISISSRGVKIDAPFRAHIRDQIVNEVDRLGDAGGWSARIHFSNETYQVRCDLQIAFDFGSTKSRDVTNDPYSSLNSALQKSVKQARKSIGKLVKRSRRVTHPSPDPLVDQESFDLSDDSPEGEHTPVIILEDLINLPIFSLRKAVERFEIEEFGTLCFINSGTKHVNLIFRRQDGHIGWIDLMSKVRSEDE